MPDHHPIFSRFNRFCGTAPPGYGIDFLGTKIDSQFVLGILTYKEGEYLQTPYPVVDEEYFEWIDLLESVAAAHDSYTMIDLGAGYGRWAVRAAYAVQQFNPNLPCRVIAVEAEPTVFTWMGRHFENNGICAAKHSLINRAVSEDPGDALFYIGAPPGQWDRSLNDWYGQSLIRTEDMSGDSEEAGEYCGFKVRRHWTGWRSISLPTISLDGLLKNLERVDLIDMDIEGQELPSIRAAIEQLDAKVKRLHIGTHGIEIERDLKELLSSHGWECQTDYSVFSTNQTPWGQVSFENGVQSWVNPK